MELGAKIYYTGDMANPDGWFEVIKNQGPTVDLQELPDGFPDAPRTILGIFTAHIGTEYAGHCGTRFVTEAAYKNYLQSRLNSLAKQAA